MKFFFFSFIFFSLSACASCCEAQDIVEVQVMGFLQSQLGAIQSRAVFSIMM